jgi:hypothetical protein
LRVGYAARREHESAGADPKLLLADPEEVFAVKAKNSSCSLSWTCSGVSTASFSSKIVNAPAHVARQR